MQESSMRRIPMMRGARGVMELSARIKESEEALIVTDGSSPLLAETLAAAAAGAGAEATLAFIPPWEEGPAQFPKPISKAMAGADAVFLLLGGRAKDFEAIQEALRADRRLIDISGLTDELASGGCLEVDFQSQGRLLEEFSERLSSAEALSLSNPAGTAMTMSLRGKEPFANTGLASPGKLLSLPDLRVGICPVKGTAEGELLVDGSIPSLGLRILAEPPHLKVQKGFLREPREGREPGEESSTPEKLKEILEEGELEISFLSFGFNPCSPVPLGSAPYDLGVMGSSCLAFSRPGEGEPSLLFVLLRVSLEVDGEVLLAGGRPKFLRGERP